MEDLLKCLWTEGREKCKRPRLGSQEGRYKQSSFLLQFDEFQPLVEEPKNLVKANCELFEKLGEYGFQNA